MGVYAQNKMEEGYMSNAGAKEAAKVAMMIQQQQLDQLKEMAPAMKEIANSVKVIEEKIFSGMTSLIETTKSIIDKLF